MQGRHVRRYLSLGRTPHGRRLLVGGALVRPGQAAVDLVVLLALHRATGSFALGGAAIAALTVTSSASTALQGRLMDRLGIGRVLVPMALAMVAAIGALSAALAIDAPAMTLVLLAGAVGGLLPSVGAPLRTLWSSVFEDPHDQATAFAYESLAQDLGYIAGPAALGAVASAISPIVALGACGALIATGALTVSAIPATRSPPSAAPKTGGPTPRIARPLARTGAALLAVGGALGAIDVAAPAFATQHGSPAASGLLLGAFSLGSAAGGLAYGARKWRSRLASRLLVCVLALTGLLLLPAAASSLALLAAALMLAGVPLAAALTTAYLLAAQDAPPSRRTEAFSWLSLALNVGASLGSVGAGTIASDASANGAFVLASASAALGAGTLAAATVSRRWRSLRGRRGGGARLPQ